LLSVYPADTIKAEKKEYALKPNEVVVSEMCPASADNHGGIRGAEIGPLLRQPTEVSRVVVKEDAVGSFGSRATYASESIRTAAASGRALIRRRVRMTTEVISPDLKTTLRRLRLSRIPDTLPERLVLARQQEDAASGLATADPQR
jgi:hypothetical protein